MNLLKRGLVIVSFCLVTAPAQANFFWNEAFTASGTDTISTSVGTVSVSIEDLNNNVVKVTSFVNSSAFPSIYNVDNRSTFREENGGRYEVTFTQPVDNPTIAVGSLGNGSMANRFILESVNGVAGTVDIVFADAWAGASGAEGAGTIGARSSYGPNTYGTSAGIGIDSEATGTPKNQNLTGVTFYESKEGNIVARINQANVTSFIFDLAHTENYMTLLVGYESAGNGGSLSADQSSVAADGVSESTITVQVQDRFGNNFINGGDTVVMSSSFGTLSSVTDNNDGTYSATLSSATAGSASVTATVNGQAVSAGSPLAVNFTNSSPGYNAPPLLVSTSPADNATGVPLSPTLTLTFNEPVTKGNGNIQIRRSSDNALVETIDVTSSAASVTGQTMTVTPSVTLAASTSYYITTDSGVVVDATAGTFAGFSSPTTLNFSTIADGIPPTIAITAAEGSDGFSSDDSSLSLTFTSNEATSNFDASDIAVTNGSLSNFASVSATVYTATLTPQAAGAVTVDVAAGAFTDAASNNNIAATQFNWTYGVDPTTNAEVMASMERMAQASTSFAMTSLRLVNRRMTWLERNEPTSRQNINLKFADNRLNTLINGGDYSLLASLVTDRESAAAQFGQAPELFAQDLAEDVEALALSQLSEAMGIVPFQFESDETLAGWSVWTEGDVTIGEVDASRSSASQSTEQFSVTTGMDRAIDDSKLAGFALTVSRGDSDIGADGGGMDSEGISVSLYGGFEGESGWGVEGVVGMGQTNLDLVRIQQGQRLTGDRTADIAFASVTGRHVPFDLASFMVSSYLKAEVADVSMEPFTESGGSLALAYGRQNTTNVLASIGADLYRPIQLSKGTLNQLFGIQATHDFTGTSDSTLNYVGDTRLFTVTSDKLADTRLKFRVGFDYSSRDSLTWTVSYDREEVLGAAHFDSATVRLNYKF